MAKRIIVGISGATGVIYGIRLLKELHKRQEVETHLIISEAGIKNIAIETEEKIDDLYKLADYYYSNSDLAAPVSSGSFLAEAMVIMPCTIKTLSGIANSYNANLMTRVADVCLKEKRTLILGVRETPLHSGHLELMHKASSLGALILPPVPAFYHRPQNISDIINQTVGKVLDNINIEHNLFKRWKS